MSGFEGLGRILIIVGAVVLITGLLLVFSGRVSLLGQLPGDITIKRDGVTFYFPIVSCLLLSVVVTLVVGIILRFMGR